MNAGVEETVAMITGTIPGKVFRSADGEALILGDDHQVIAVTPGTGEFNNGNPTTAHAYLISTPLADITDSATEQADFAGWAPGFDA